MTTIDQKTVIELLEYQSDGTLMWRATGKGRRLNKAAGCYMQLGYLSISINMRRYLVHRIVFLYHHGYMPKEIDHKNGNPSDNRIENLRDATRSQNVMNTSKRTDNKSGYPGIYYSKDRNKWRCQLWKNGKSILSFSSENLEEVIEKRNQIGIREFGEFFDRKSY